VKSTWGLVLLVYLSLGCTASEQVQTTETLEPHLEVEAVITAVPHTTIPLLTTLPPVKNTLPPITSQPITPINVNPANLVLIPEDFGNITRYFVIDSDYRNLEIAREYGWSERSIESFIESGWIDNYYVKYSVSLSGSTSSEKIWLVSNEVNRFPEKNDIGKMMDFLENVTQSNWEGNDTTLEGKNYGDRIIYSSWFDPFHGPGYGVHVQVENYIFTISINSQEISDLSLPNLYPYIEIMINRITSKAEVQPPQLDDYWEE